MPPSPRKAPALQRSSSWTRLPSCPTPWEETLPRSLQLIGTDSHGPLHPQALTWGVGYHFPQGMLRAALGPLDGDDGNYGNDSDDHNHNHNHEEAGGEIHAPNDQGAQHSQKRGDIWLIEKAIPGTCPSDADAAGHVLTSPRLDERGDLAIEVRYGCHTAVQGQGDHERQVMHRVSHIAQEESVREEPTDENALQEDNDTKKNKRGLGEMIRKMLNVKCKRNVNG